jgi:hypothetical protein
MRSDAKGFSANVKKSDKPFFRFWTNVSELTVTTVL